MSRFNVVHGGRVLDVLSMSFENAIDQYAWRGNIDLLSVEQFNAIKIRDVIRISVFYEQYTMIVDSKNYSDEANEKPTLSIGIISPAELYSTMQDNRFNTVAPQSAVWPIPDVVTQKKPLNERTDYYRNIRSNVVSSNIWSQIDSDVAKISDKGVSAIDLIHLNASFVPGATMSLSLIWEVPTFIVPYGVITCENESCIGYLKTLADACSAKIRSDKNGSVYIYNLKDGSDVFTQVIYNTFTMTRDVISCEYSEPYQMLNPISGFRFREEESKESELIKESTPELRQATLNVELADDLNSSQDFYPGMKVYMYVKRSGWDEDQSATYGELRREGYVERPYTIDVRDVYEQRVQSCEIVSYVVTGDPERVLDERWEVWSLRIPDEDITRPYEIRVEFTASNPVERKCESADDVNEEEQDVVKPWEDGYLEYLLNKQRAFFTSQGSYANGLMVGKATPSGIVEEVTNVLTIGNEDLKRRYKKARKAQIKFETSPQLTFTVPFRPGVDINQGVRVETKLGWFTGITESVRFTVDREKAMINITARGTIN
jgi:hypothetical protein